MDTFNNQKIVIIDRTLIKNKIPREILFAAMNKLDNVTFKLWIYIIVQKQDEFALSAVNFCKVSGKCRSTYKNAVRELIEKGFLVLTNEARNEYTFYDYPNQDTMPATEDDINISIANDNCINAEGFVF